MIFTSNQRTTSATRWKNSDSFHFLRVQFPVFRLKKMFRHESGSTEMKKACGNGRDLLSAKLAVRLLKKSMQVTVLQKKKPICYNAKMNINEIRQALFRMQDTKYRDFQAKLLPTVNPQSIIGVRTPQLRTFAKTLYKQNDFSDFLNTLPHKYFDENQLHAFLICEIKDFDFCLEKLKKFLPFVDNWATCDQMSPKIFKKHKKSLLEQIKIWILSEKTYTVRFAVGMLMQHFLDEDFDLEYPKMVLKIHSEEYYIKMMIAWYFATALAKQYNAVLPFLENQNLEKWTHNKSIQKALESYRITDEQKKYLRTLKIS